MQLQNQPAAIIVKNPMVIANIAPIAIVISINAPWNKNPYCDTKSMNFSVIVKTSCGNSTKSIILTKMSRTKISARSETIFVSVNNLLIYRLDYDLLHDFYDFIVV